MASRYDQELPHRQVRRLDAERAHIERLGDIARQWTAAAQIVTETRNSLFDHGHKLRRVAWGDQAGEEFEIRVNRNVTVLDTWRGAFDENLHRLKTLIHTLSFDFPDIYRNVCKERDDYEREVHAKGQADPRPYQERAGAQTARLDSYYHQLTWIMIAMASGSPWDGPRAALPGPGDSPTGAPSGSPAGSPSGSPTGAGDPRTAGTPETTPEPGAPQTPEPGDPRTTDPLAAASAALQAAQDLLGGEGTQVPDPLTANMVEPAPFDYAPYSGPALAGLDAGQLGGSPGGATPVGGGAGGGAGAGGPVSGPGYATPPGSGNPPVPPSSLAGGTSAAASAAGRGTPPMMPPGAGAGAAAGARRNAIRPGDADRPATESRPRPRRGTAGPVTPGVALAGRAGAAQPKPAARRSWDSDNDSLQVLDEHLWQVNPQEEESFHGQDRRRPVRDGGDRSAAHGAADAGLVGPGGPAHQPTRAR